MKKNFDDDSEMEDFGLDSLFEEIEDLPGVLIDEHFNYSTDPELDSLQSSDSFIACVAVLQPGDDFLLTDSYENSTDQSCCLFILSFLIMVLISSFIAILFLYFIFMIALRVHAPQRACMP